MNHRILLENTFSGPMDLLLYLVKRDEIDIHDIPIAHLTREYLAEIERMPSIDVDLASEFMAMASILVEIKGRMLLPPTEPVDGEEDEDTLDPRAGLVKALLEYKRFKEIASELGRLADDHANRFARFAPTLQPLQEEPGTMDELGVMDLFAAFQNMVRTLTSQRPREIVNDEVPTEVRMQQVTAALQGRDRATFTSLLSDNPTKGEMVGFFIALLELIRLRQVHARQSLDFSEIYLYPPGADESPDVPAESAPLPRRRLRLCCADPAKARPLQTAATYTPGARVALFPAFARIPPQTAGKGAAASFLAIPGRGVCGCGAAALLDGHRCRGSAGNMDTRTRGASVPLLPLSVTTAGTWRRVQGLQVAASSCCPSAPTAASTPPAVPASETVAGALPGACAEFHAPASSHDAGIHTTTGATGLHEPASAIQATAAPTSEAASCTEMACSKRFDNTRGQRPTATVSKSRRTAHGVPAGSGFLAVTLRTSTTPAQAHEQAYRMKEGHPPSAATRPRTFLPVTSPTTPSVGVRARCTVSKRCCIPAPPIPPLHGRTR